MTSSENPVSETLVQSFSQEDSSHRGRNLGDWSLVQSLKKSLFNAQSEVDYLKRELKELTQQKLDECSRNSKLLLEIEVLEITLKVSDNKIKESEECIANIKNELAAEKASFTYHQKLCEDWKLKTHSEIESLKAALLSERSTSVIAQDNYKALNYEMDSFKLALSIVMSAEDNEISSSLPSHESEPPGQEPSSPPSATSKTSATNAYLSKKISLLEDSLRSTSTQLSDLRIELATQQSTFTNKETELNNLVASLRNDILKLEGINGNIIAELSNTKLVLVEAENRLTESEKALEDANDKLRASDGFVSELRNELCNLRMAIISESEHSV